MINQFKRGDQYLPFHLGLLAGSEKAEPVQDPARFQGALDLSLLLFTTFHLIRIYLVSNFCLLNHQAVAEPPVSRKYYQRALLLPRPPQSWVGSLRADQAGSGSGRNLARLPVR